MTVIVHNLAETSALVDNWSELLMSKNQFLVVSRLFSIFITFFRHRSVDTKTSESLLFINILVLSPVDAKTSGRSFNRFDHGSVAKNNNFTNPDSIKVSNKLVYG